MSDLLGDELYATLAPIHYDDASRGFPLRAFCRAFGSMLEELNTLIRDSEDGLGWSAILDPDRAPEGALPWLGQFVGVRVTEGASVDDQRAEIRRAAGRRRGTPSAIIEAVMPTLTGAQTVNLIERDGGNAYQIRVQTYSSMTPNAALSEAKARAQKPAGLIMTFQVIDGQTYDQAEAAFVDYDAAELAYADYDTAASDMP